MFSLGAVSKQETFRLACLSSTSGPMFFGGRGRRGNVSKFGARLDIICLTPFGSVSGLLLMRFTVKKSASAEVPALSFGKNDSNPLTDSVLSVLAVGGAIAIFYAFSGILRDALGWAGLENGFLSATVTGLIEMTSGCKLCADIGGIYSVALSAFLVTFGGGCVLIQQTVFLSPRRCKNVPPLWRSSSCRVASLRSSRSACPPPFFKSLRMRRGV